MIELYHPPYTLTPVIVKLVVEIDDCKVGRRILC